MVTNVNELLNSSGEKLVQGQDNLILVVEDNKTLLEATCVTLEFLNYRVLSATNGEEALTVYRDNVDKIDLILSDVVMPKMDGFELLARLKQESKMPYVVLMSGFPRDRAMPPEISALISGWMTKPIDMQELARLFNSLLA